MVKSCPNLRRAIARKPMVPVFLYGGGDGKLHRGLLTAETAETAETRFCNRKNGLHRANGRGRFWGDRLPEVTRKPLLGPKSLSLQCWH